MNKLIDELKKIVTFKNTTEAGDHVIIVSKDPELIVYGVVNSVERDPERKDEWWIVNLHLLTLPPQKISWILREPQFTGQETFTMQGAKRFMQAVYLDAGQDSSLSDNKSQEANINAGKKRNPLSRVK